MSKWDYYYANPKNPYKRFINKKWIERTDVYQSKEAFIKIENPNYKKLSESERATFMSAPPPNKRKISKYFTKIVEDKNPAPDIPDVMLVGEASSSCRDDNEGEGITSNSICAIPDRHGYLYEKELALVRKMVVEIGGDGERFLTEDIKSDSGLMETLTKFAYDWDKFFSLKKSYEEGKVKSRESTLKKTLEIIAEEVRATRDAFVEVSSINISLAMPSHVLSQTSLKKSKTIVNLLQHVGRLNEQISDKKLHRSLIRRIHQQHDNQEFQFRRASSELTEVLCQNDLRLLWDDVFELLIDFKNSNHDHKCHISTDELISIAEEISSNIVTDCEQLEVEITSPILKLIIRLMPVMYFINDEKSLFINLHEFVLTPGVLEYFLRIRTEEVFEVQESTATPEEKGSELQRKPSKKKKGHNKNAFVEKFPGIVDEVTEFVKQHGYAAQCRRRDDSKYSSGVTIMEVRKHLYRKFPNLKTYTVSLSTIRRMFEAPNKACKASLRYKGYVSAKVGKKFNSYREEHLDAHYLFARNKMRRELASLFSEDITMISVDDMAKIKVGAPAVSRYHQVNRLYPCEDMPNLPDHDFPVAGYLLATSGYMFLQPPPTHHNQEEISNLNNASTYDNVSTTSVAEFDSMELEGSPGSIFKVLQRQAYLHLNVEVSLKGCQDSVINEIKDRSKNDENNSEEIIKAIENGEINDSILLTIFNAASSLFQCKIVVFNRNADRVESKEIKPTKITESPLYIFVGEGGHSCQSLIFKQENIDSYSDVLSHYDREIVRDNLGRVHLSTPCSGEAHLYLRSSKYHHSSIATHMTDLYNILKSRDNFTSLMLLADGGPDFSPSNVLNTLFYYRLFKKLDMDMLTVSTYAARYSAYNPVEHLWSPMSNRLSGVVFPAKLEGERNPPSKQAIPTEKKKEKEFVLFDNAIDSLEQCWSDSMFDGFPVSINKVHCGSDNLLWDDIDDVKAFLKAPLRRLHEFAEVRDEFRNMLSHIDRHLNEIIFMRCHDRSCCTEWRCDKLKVFLGKTDYKLPAPVKSSSREGHYGTFLENCINNYQEFGDNGQPTAVNNNLGSCNSCKSYNFKSKTGKTRHISMFHSRNKKTYSASSFKCNVCSSAYPNQTQLDKHKRAEKHRARDIKNSNSSVEPPKKKKKTTKKRTIMDFIRQKNSDSESGMESASEGEIEMLVESVNDDIEERTMDGDRDDTNDAALPLDETVTTTADNSMLENVEEEERDESSHSFQSPHRRNNVDENIDPKVGEYWIMQNGDERLYAVVAEDNPISVQYFVQKSGCYRLCEATFEAPLEDFVSKVRTPDFEPVGRNRMYYHFT